jgi:hypothetical protein
MNIRVIFTIGRLIGTHRNCIGRTVSLIPSKHRLSQEVRFKKLMQVLQ